MKADSMVGRQVRDPPSELVKTQGQAWGISSWRYLAGK